MIDWLSCSFPYHGPEFGWRFLKMNLTTKQLEQGHCIAAPVEGSYSAKMLVQVIQRRMYISGNPVKFLTGQNVFGTDDLKSLLIMTYDEIIGVMNMPDCLAARRSFDTKDAVKLTRVDCTFHYEVGTDDDVRNWLRAMAKSTHVSHRGRGHYDDGMCSLIFGVNMKEGKKPKGSQYSSFKFYNKYRELKKHPPTCKKLYAEACAVYTKGKVRAEALYRGKELQRLGKGYLSDWTDNTSLELNSAWIAKMDISENAPQGEEIPAGLPAALRSTYKLWLLGVDLQSVLSKSTFYRHRASLLEFDVDIGVYRSVDEDEDVENLIPVLKVLQATPIDPYAEEEMFMQIFRTRHAS